MLKPTTLLVLVGLTASTSPAAAQEDTTHFRVIIAGGPSAASPSGRQMRMSESKVCFLCQSKDQLVTGATDGRFHLSIATSNDLGRSRIAFRMEAMFNRATTGAQVLPPEQCKLFKCAQPRKASRDDAIMFGAGLEVASPSWRRLSGYVLVTGGVMINKLGWSTDTITRKETAHGIAFGPYVAPGAGVRYQMRRKLALYAQWRRAQTFVVPGSSMTPISVGLVYSASMASY